MFIPCISVSPSLAISSPLSEAVYKTLIFRELFTGCLFFALPDATPGFARCLFLVTHYRRAQPYDLIYSRPTYKSAIVRDEPSARYLFFDLCDALPYGTMAENSSCLCTDYIIVAYLSEFCFYFNYVTFSYLQRVYIIRYMDEPSTT